MAEKGPPNGETVYADAMDPGLRFILTSQTAGKGGLQRLRGNGHFGTIVGRGGAGKSILALQLVTGLLQDGNRNDDRATAAFYFTLEARPEELRRQVMEFSWGRNYYHSSNWWTTGENKPHARVSGSDQYCRGLYLIGVPAPADSLNAVILQIRQVIARQLDQINEIAAIVIDPMGAISTGADIRVELNHLKDLAESHRTFLFLLAEKHAFERHTSMEHYSQSIIHLEHDPDQQQHRRLHVQKARNQSFRAGYHQFELQQENGLRVFPSTGAQSAVAHADIIREQEERRRPVPFFPDERRNRFLLNEKLDEGSAVFLMGPPGTFKEQLAERFAIAGDGPTLFVSFKLERKIIEGGPVTEIITADREVDKNLKKTVYFYDARSPLLTPEEILFTVHNWIAGRPKGGFRRAVIWGLRRLADFPNFADGRSVQFLEALVTLLKSHTITSLLVDWPDKQTPSTVPIIDLCEYIFLTRVCLTAEAMRSLQEGNSSREILRPRESGQSVSIGRRSARQVLRSVPAQRVDDRDVEVLDELWAGDTQHIALLRVQRTKEGVHHDQGAVLKRTTKKKFVRYETGTPVAFERLWIRYGIPWEEDISLQS